MHRYYDEGSAGGDSPASADPLAQALEPKATEADKGEAEKGKPDTGEAGGKATEKPTVESLTKELENWKGKHSEVATRLGVQSGQVGKLKAMADLIQKDPRKLIESIAKKGGLTLSFGDLKTPDLTKALQEGTPEDQAKAITDIQTLKDQQAEQRLNAILDPINEQLTAAKYEDYDDLGDSRDAISVAHSTGQLPDRELYHLAARGMIMSTALEKAVEHGKKARDEELAKKNQEQIDGSGTIGKSKAAGASMVLEEVLDGLEDIR